MCAQDAIGYGLPDVHGSQHFKQFWRGFRDAFSNIHVDIHDAIEQDDDDKVVARWTMAMTDTGAFLGIAPANKRVTVNGIGIQRFVNRQISAGRDNWDQLGAGSPRSRTGPKFL